MSLITDLLSKVKQQEPKRDIPPLLKESIIQGTLRRKVRRRIVVSALVLLIAVAAGTLAVHSLDYFFKPSSVALKEKAVDPSVPVSPKINISADQPDIKTTSGLTETNTSQAQAKNSANSRYLSPGVEPHTIKTETAKIGLKAQRARNIDKLKETGQGKAASVKRETPYGQTESIARQDRDTQLYTAKAYENEKNYRMALSNYRSVLAADPGNYIVMNNIASVLIQMSSFEEAVSYAEKALHIRRNYVPSLINLGIAYSRLGKDAEAERCMKESLSVEPLNRLALLNIGLLYEKRDLYDRAAENYLRLKNINDVRGYLGLARIAEKQNKTVDAIHYYRTVMFLENRNSQIWNFANDRLSQLVR